MFAHKNKTFSGAQLLFAMGGIVACLGLAAPNLVRAAEPSSDPLNLTKQATCPDGQSITVSGRATDDEIKDRCSKTKVVTCPNGRTTRVPTDATASDIAISCGAAQTIIDNATSNTTSGNLKADCKNSNITKENCGILAYIVKFIDVLSGLTGIIIITVITFRGIQYTFSRENAQDTAKAKDGIRDAVLALVFYLIIMSFLQWVIPGGLF